MKTDVLSLGTEKLTPLHLACKNGCSEAAMLLLTKGAPIDVRDNLGRTPLHLAAQFGGTHITRVMMLCGAKKGIWDDNHKTPFDYVVSAGRKSTVESLLVYRPPSMSAKQNISFLFHKMLAEGEHKEKREMTKKERVVNDAADAAGGAVRKGLGILRWGANMVRTGARIADSAARGDNETAKMKEERLAREAVEGTGVVKVGRDIKKTWNKAFAGVRAFRQSRQTVDLDAEAGFSLDDLAGDVKKELEMEPGGSEENV